MAEAVGFYTDTTVCIGCKACEVACHQWNALPARNGGEVPLLGPELRQHRSRFRMSTGGTSSSSSSSVPIGPRRAG